MLTFRITRQELYFSIGCMVDTEPLFCVPIWTDRSDFVWQVHAGTLDLPPSVLLRGDSHAACVCSSLSLHSDCHRHRQVSDSDLGTSYLDSNAIVHFSQ
jgi:hypothetical protein